MDTDKDTYEVKNVTVEIERVFTGEKTLQELILELLQKRYESACSRL